MPKFLTTIKTSSAVEEVILNAEKEIVLVSPFLKISSIFLQRLHDASNRGVSIKIVYGKDELQPSEKQRLLGVKNVTIYFLSNLHAKCYYNEKEMVITSMNMYEFSERNNREMGVQLDVINDAEVYNEAIKETASIISHSIKQNDPQNNETHLINAQARFSNTLTPKVRLTYSNWKSIVQEELSFQLHEAFSWRDKNGEVTFRSKSHTLDCYIRKTRGIYTFNVQKILTSKYYLFLKEYEKDIRQKTKLDFMSYEGRSNEYSTVVVHDHTPLHTQDFNFVSQDDLPVIVDAIMNFASVLFSLEGEYKTKKYLTGT